MKWKNIIITMNKDIVLDTNILADFISAYYSFNISTTGNFEPYSTLTKPLIDKLNIILNNYRNNNTLSDGVIVASTFAFIEIARKFKEISNNRFTILQLKAFIHSHPEWFVIAPLNNELFCHLNTLPNSIRISNRVLPIEWADTIHVATALNRDPNCMIATTDNRLKGISTISSKLIL